MSTYINIHKDKIKIYAGCLAISLLVFAFIHIYISNNERIILIKKHYYLTKAEIYDYCYRRNCHALFYRFNYKGKKYQGQTRYNTYTKIGDSIEVSIDSTNPNNSMYRYQFEQSVSD